MRIGCLQIIIWSMHAMHALDRYHWILYYLVSDPSTTNSGISHSLHAGFVASIVVLQASAVQYVVCFNMQNMSELIEFINNNSVWITRIQRNLTWISQFDIWTRRQFFLSKLGQKVHDFSFIKFLTKKYRINLPFFFEVSPSSKLIPLPLSLYSDLFFFTLTLLCHTHTKMDKCASSMIVNTSLSTNQN